MKKIFFALLIFGALFAQASEIRIVSLGPYITENICLLGLEKNITGLTVHDEPERKKGREIVGTLLDPSIEKILTLKPDVVIGSKEGNRAESLQKMQQFGIKTLVLDELYTFDDICRNFISLGRALKAGEKAERIVKEQRLRLKKIAQLAGRQADRKKVFFVLGFKPLFTTGSATYINGMIEYAGGTNIFKDVDKKWFSCSVEEVLKRNPENIVFLKMEEESVVLWDRLRDVEAVKKKRITGIEPTVIGSPTPVSFADSVENLYKMIYCKD
ncbi:MAG: ABC transporter substrate-binding protein [Candidatus Omnitrophica bacterium]|nr:ABC transporter substrate-binding protein [Candidatus Omnitrophota bacterium]